MVRPIFVDANIWVAWFNKKDISFADCASAIIAKEYGAKHILTFDQHFRVFEKDLDLKIWNSNRII